MPSQPDDTPTLAALVLILLGNHEENATRDYSTALLAPLGIKAASIATVLSLLHPHLPEIAHDVAPATASGHVNRTQIPRTAGYLLNASRRLSQGGSLDAERHYLSQHLDAQRTRQEVAERIDAAARMFGPTLGWRAVLDSHTTPECRKANGRNFHFAHPPLIGFPGTLHGGTCRCIPGPPFDGADSVDQGVAGVLIHA